MWPPDPRIPDYNGPYPVNELVEARSVLITELVQSGGILERLKPKLGIDSRFGPAQVPPPVPRVQPAPYPYGNFRATNPFPTDDVGYGNTSFGNEPVPLIPIQRPNTVPGDVHGYQGYNKNIGSAFNASGDSGVHKPGGVNYSTGTTAMSNPYGGNKSKRADMSQPMTPHQTVNMNSTTVAPAAARPNLRQIPMEPVAPPIRLMGRLLGRQSEVPITDSSESESQETETIPAFFSNILSESAKKKSATITRDDTPVAPPLGRPAEASASGPKSDGHRLSGSSSDFNPSAFQTNPRATLAVKRKSNMSEESTFARKTMRQQDDGMSLAVGEPSQGCFPTYKCDFCMYSTRNVQKVEDHLINAKHFSGSIYTAKQGDSSSASSSKGLMFVAIQKILAIKNEHSKTQALVVACPDCREVFEDIFMCGIHHKYTHGSVNGFYSVCPVIGHETVTVPVDPVCLTCSATFTRHAELHGHWKAVPEHRPFTKAKQDRTNVFELYICPYCRKTFYCDFLACKTHILNHGKTMPGKVTFAMEVKQILQPTRKEELLPFDTSGNHSDGIESELTILYNTRRHFKGMNGSTAKVKAIKERIRILKMFQGRGDDANSDNSG